MTGDKEVADIQELLRRGRLGIRATPIDETQLLQIPPATARNSKGGKCPTQAVGTAWVLPHLREDPAFQTLEKMMEHYLIPMTESKPKTDEEWEAVARNNKCDAEVSALLRLLDLERFKVKKLQVQLSNTHIQYSRHIQSLVNKQLKTEKQHDWTAFSNNPTAPLLTDE